MTTRKSNDPRQTTEYLLGQLAMKVDAIDEKLTELCKEMKEDKELRGSIQNRVDDLEAWRERHIEYHKKEQDNIIISKNTFWVFISIVIASGLLFRLIELWRHGWRP